MPDPPSIDKIADVFGLPVDTVLTIAGHRPATEPVNADDPRELLAQRVRRMPNDPILIASIEGVMRAFEDAMKRKEGKP